MSEGRGLDDRSVFVYAFDLPGHHMRTSRRQDRRAVGVRKACWLGTDFSVSLLLHGLVPVLWNCSHAGAAQASFTRPNIYSPLHHGCNVLLLP